MGKLYINDVYITEIDNNAERLHNKILGKAYIYMIENDLNPDEVVINFIEESGLQWLNAEAKIITKEEYNNCVKIDLNN